MRKDLKSWLTNGGMPADFYELLGMPRFFRDRKALIEAGRSCYADLQRYQNADEAVRSRARTLQLQLAAAVRVFSSDEAWRTTTNN